MGRYRKQWLGVAATGLVALSPWAQAELTGTATVVSDYLFNGISQTGERPAFQASLDYSRGGFYAGVWTSNVDFPLDGDDAHREIDYYAGFAGDWSEQLGYDVGVSHYQYPGAESEAEFDYTEVYAALKLFGHTELKAWYSDDYSGNTGAAWVGRLSHTREWLGTAWTAEYSRVEHLDEEGYWNGRDGYNAWRLGAAWVVAGFDVELSYHNTDLRGGAEYSRDDGDERVVLSVGRTFTLLD